MLRPGGPAAAGAVQLTSIVLKFMALSPKRLTRQSDAPGAAP